MAGATGVHPDIGTGAGSTTAIFIVGITTAGITTATMTGVGIAITILIPGAITTGGISIAGTIPVSGIETIRMAAITAVATTTRSVGTVDDTDLEY
jgi:hypothetical protein